MSLWGPGPKTFPTWGPFGTLAWSVLIAIVFLVTQLFILLIYFFPTRGLPREEAKAAFMNLRFDGIFLSVCTFATLLVCTPLIMGIVKLKRGSNLKDYLALRRSSLRQLLRWSLFIRLLFAERCDRLLAGCPYADFMLKAYWTASPRWLLWLAPFFAAPSLKRSLAVSSSRESSHRDGLGRATIVTAILWAAIHTQYDWYGISSSLAWEFFCTARAKTNSTLLTMWLLASSIPRQGPGSIRTLARSMHRVRPLRTALGINAVPAAGWFLGDWSAGTTLVVFWLETLIGTLLVAGRIVLHRRVRPSQGHWYYQAPQGHTPQATSSSGSTYFTAFLVPALVFTLAHGVFLAVLGWMMISKNLTPEAKVDRNHLLAGLIGVLVFQIADFLMDPSGSGAAVRLGWRLGQQMLGRVIVIIHDHGGMAAVVSPRKTNFLASSFFENLLNATCPASVEPETPPAWLQREGPIKPKKDDEPS